MTQNKPWYWAALLVWMVTGIGTKKPIMSAADIQNQIELMDLDIHFLAKCPTCGGKMSEDNFFCCHSCYLMSGKSAD